MNKEEILNRLIQKSICINAGGKGCYSPYTNDMDWFSDIDNLILMYEQLQQENKKQKEVINKAIECINKYEIIRAYYEYIDEDGYDEYNYTEDFKSELLDILDEVE